MTAWEPNPNPKAPDFEPGNTVSIVHGAHSPRVIALKAAEIHDALLEAAPYLAEPKFLPAVDRYLKATAREHLLHDHIQRICDEKGAGRVPISLWPEATAATRLAAKLGSELGLDPLGHARIRALNAGSARDLGGLQALAEQGRGITEQRQGELPDGGEA
jgi:hypothetical protein